MGHAAARVRPLGSEDVAALVWIARHGMVTTGQAAGAAGWSPARARLRWRQLETLRLLQRERVWQGMDPILRVTGRGIALCDLDLKPARLDLARIRHSASVAGLSEDLLTLHPGSTWITERELRRDRMRDARERRRDRSRRTPDGMLISSDGSRLAVELDLTPKRSGKLELLVGAYALDRDVDRVLWYLPSETAVERMAQVVRARGLVQLVEPRLRRVARLPW